MTVKIRIEAAVGAAVQQVQQLKQSFTTAAAEAQKLSGVKVGVETGPAQQQVDAFARNIAKTAGTVAVGVNTSDIDKALGSIERLNEALVKTGQGGKALKDIHLNTKSFAAAHKILMDVQGNLRTISRTDFGKDILARVKKTGQDESNPLGWEFEKLFPGDPGRASQAYDRYMAKLVFGSKYEPAELQDPAEFYQQMAGKKSGQDKEKDGGVWSTLKWGAGMGLAFAGLRSLSEVVGNAMSQTDTLRAGTETAWKRSLSGDTFDEVTAGMKTLADQLQMTVGEAAQLSAEYVRAANVTGNFAGELQDAGQLSRGLGMEPGQGAQAMGKVSSLGYGADRNALREFAGLIAHTIGSSHMFGRSEQVMGDMVDHLAKIADQQGRTASPEEMGTFGKLLSDLYQNKALTGGGAQAILQGLGQLGKGGSTEQEFFAWRAFEKTGAPRNYVEFEKFKDLDAFGEYNGKAKIEWLWPEMQKMAPYMGGANPTDNMALLLKTLGPGLNMQLSAAAVEAIGDMNASGGFGQFRGWLDQMGVDMSAMTQEAWAPLVKLYRDQGATNIKGLARQYLGDGQKTSAEDKARLQSLLDKEDIASLRELLPQVMARTGTPANPAEDDRRAQVSLTNALQDLLQPLKDLQTVLKDLAAGIKPISDWVIEKFGKGADAIIGTAEANIAPMNIADDGLQPGTPSGEGLEASMGGGFLGHLAEMEKSRGLEPGTLSRLMMQESSGRNLGYHYQDGPTNPMHSDYGLFGIKKDYTGKDPGYGVRPLQDTSPEEQARFAADYLAALSRETGSQAGGLAAYHTGMGGWNSTEGRRYADSVMAKPAVPASAMPAPLAEGGIRDATGSMGAFGYRAHGHLRDRKAFIVHHTGPGMRSVADVQRVFGERGFPAQYVIDKEGEIFRTLPKGERGLHIRSGKYLTPLGKQLDLSNDNTEGVEVIAGGDRDVTPKQIASVDRLRRLLGYGAGQVFGHGEINRHKQETEGSSAAEAIRRLGDNLKAPAAADLSRLPVQAVPDTPAPKTPEKLEKVSQSLSQQAPANARLDGQVEMALVLQNERGQELHRRTGLLKSEPMLHGSGGSNNFSNRFVWNDTSMVG